MLRRRHHELPPTAGLPLRWGDLQPGAATLAADIATQLDTPPLQLECSGSACLVLGLITLSELRPARRRVIVPAYTCPLVAIAVHQAGLELQLCDLRPGHYDMDPAALRALCDERTLAIIPTHLAGRVANVDGAIASARRVGAYVIEDAAQALGARQRGRSVGMAGDLGFFSLAAGKGLSIYEGGLLLARDPELRERLTHTAARLVPKHAGIEWKRSIELFAYAALYRPGGLRLGYGGPLRRALRRGDLALAVGDNFPLTIPLHRVGEWRQTVGARAAARLPAFNQQLIAQAQQRLPRLRGMDGVSVMQDPLDAQGTWPFYLLLLPDEKRRDAALSQLWSAGYGVSRLFIHALTGYAYLNGQVPSTDVFNAHDFAARSLSISNSPWVTDADFDTICRTLESALR